MKSRRTSRWIVACCSIALAGVTLVAQPAHADATTFDEDYTVEAGEVFDGDIVMTGDTKLLVRGTVNGDIHHEGTSGEVWVDGEQDSTATVNGNIRTLTAQVRVWDGRVVGDITAAQILTLLDSSHVEGNVKHINASGAFRLHNSSIDGDLTVRHNSIRVGLSSREGVCRVTGDIKVIDTGYVTLLSCQVEGDLKVSESNLVVTASSIEGDVKQSGPGNLDLLKSSVVHSDVKESGDGDLTVSADSIVHGDIKES